MMGSDLVAMGGATLFLVGVVACVITFLPSIIVLKNEQHNNRVGVILLNVFFGWSLIGWVIALIWAFHKPASRAQVVQNIHYQPPRSPVQKAPESQPVEPERVVKAQPLQVAHAPAALPAGPMQAVLFLDGKFLREIPLGGNDITIGRSGDNIVSVPDPMMSGRHWRVRSQNGQVEIVDVGSTNGTWKLGRTRIDRDCPAPGDWYQVGRVQLAFR